MNSPLGKVRMTSPEDATFAASPSFLGALWQRRTEGIGQKVDLAALQAALHNMRLRIGTPSTPFGSSGMLVNDPMMVFRGDPDYPQHDCLGYKNSLIPDAVDMLVLGNSQVHSLQSPAGETWPAMLSACSGLAIYNGAMGGFSVMQYYLACRELGFLNAAAVVAVLYMGNNVYNSANTFKALPSMLRKGFSASAEALAMSPNIPSHHAAKINGSPPEQRAELFMKAVKTGEAGFCFARVKHITYFLLPCLRLSVQNLQNRYVACALDLALQSLNRLSSLTNRRRVPLLVLCMPTKERLVYERHRRHGDVALSSEAELLRLWTMEIDVEHRIGDYLATLQVPMRSLAPTLTDLLHEPLYAPLDADGHPSLHGRFRLAEAVAEILACTSVNTTQF